MTVFDYDPTWTVYDNGACCCVDKESPWCLMLSDCIYEYEGRFSNGTAGVKYCKWPLSEYQFKQAWYKKDRKNCKTYEEYLKLNPKVEYEFYCDQGFYNLRSTDGTLNFAFQNDENVFIIHLGFEIYYNDCGFGCVINKINNDVHCVRLSEDDGNWWAENDINIGEMSAYEWSLVTAVINDLPESKFLNKESLIEKLFTYGKQANNQK